MGPETSNTETHMNRARVLIVEDEPFIAFDLVHAIEDAGGEPVGPASTIEEALALIDANGIKAAILDVDLPDGHIGPVLEALSGTIPIVVHTGVGLRCSSAVSACSCFLQAYSLGHAHETSQGCPEHDVTRSLLAAEHSFAKRRGGFILISF
jgi:ActR/RegA family two-component response regulator